jgi:hypothetical protein
MKNPVPEKYILCGLELRLAREALDEAIEGVRAAMNSGLPPNADWFSARDRKMHMKWRQRLLAYHHLLHCLGGKVRGENTSFEILLDPERRVQR